MRGVLQGRIDTSKAFFTEGGSFWTNSTTDLLAEVSPDGPGPATRNYCNQAGYESVALIPLKTPDHIAGLLQLNDRRRGRLTREAVRFFESIAAGIGLALWRHRKAQQVRQCQKMEAVGRLAGGVAHDFRNQLTVIKGYAEMLIRRDLLAEDGKRIVGEILNAAERSTLMTSQLLAVSRRQNLQPKVVDLGETVRDLGKAMGRLLGEDIDLTVHCQGGPCPVEIDPVLFQQAMTNLLTNARDAMPRGGKLTLETFRVEANGAFRDRHPDARAGSYAAVAVRDTGCGMDEVTLGRLFEVFFTTKRGGRTAGLGLPMVHGFVKQSDGQIEVESRPGAGTTVRLYFPLRQESRPAGLGVRPVLGGGGSEPRNSGRKERDAEK